VLRFAITALIAAVYVAIGIVYLALTDPVLWVNRSLDVIRVRGRCHRFADITRATVMLDASTHKPTLVLILGTERLVSVKVTLRSEENVALSDDQRAALLRVIAESTISLPTTPNDPHGKFTHVNFPGRLAKADAIALVELNPRTDEQIPGVSRWR